MKTLVKAMDSTNPTHEKMELTVLFRLPPLVPGGEYRCVQETLSDAAVDALIAVATAATAPRADV